MPRNCLCPGIVYFGKVHFATGKLFVILCSGFKVSLVCVLRYCLVMPLVREKAVSPPKVTSHMG